VIIDSLKLYVRATAWALFDSCVVTDGLIISCDLLQED